MLGIGVTAPKKNFMENFHLIAMNPKRHSSVDLDAIEAALMKSKLPNINKKKLLIRNQSHFSSAMAGFAKQIGKKQKVNEDDILVGDGDIS